MDSPCGQIFCAKGSTGEKPSVQATNPYRMRRRETRVLSVSSILSAWYRCDAVMLKLRRRVTA